MKKNIIIQFILAMAFLMPAMAASSVDPDAPLYAKLGSVQVQYPTAKCGLRNVVIAVSLEYTGPEKTARIESFIPKINSRLFLYISDYAAKRAGKEMRHRDILKIIQSTTEKILGKDYINEVLILNIFQD